MNQVRYALPPVDLFDPVEMTPAAQQFDAIGQKERPKRKFRLAPKAIEKAKREMDERAASNDWENARGVHLVALYAWLHLAVYQVEPAEMNAVEWASASVVAQKFCVAQFEGDFAACVEFLRWTWKRESSIEARRRNGTVTNDFRITWRYQFSAKLVTDYRIDKARGR